MSDAGYDGVLDVPDDPLGAQRGRCSRCEFEFEPGDDPDCGEPGCPVALNQQTLSDMARP